MLPEQQVEILKQHRTGNITKPARRPLTGPLQWIAILLLLIVVGAIYVGFYSWGFFLGGNFHALPYWTGWGKMHSPTAGDYFLYVEVWPSTHALETIIPHTFVKGRGYLCTPRGERFYLNLSGEMRPHIYLNTIGEPIELDMWTWRTSMPIGKKTRPSFSIWGNWSKGEIAGEDRQGLSKNFLPDGRLRPQNTSAAPAQMEDVRLTLHEGTRSEWDNACRTTATLNPE